MTARPIWSVEPIEAAWWATTSTVASDGTVSYSHKAFATWGEAAGWRDVMYVPAFTSIAVASRSEIEDYQFGAIVGRTSTGAWWAMPQNDSYLPRYVGKWNEAADWRDVQVLEGGPFAASALVGRTAGGKWFRSTFLHHRMNLETEFVGQWDESAGWRDVQAVRFEDERRPFQPLNGILGRDAAGQWRMLTARFSGSTPPGGNPNENVVLGQWNEAAGWHDVDTGKFTREPVVYGTHYEWIGPYDIEREAFEVSILARRTGVDVLVEDAPGVPHAYQITYRVPATGFERVYIVPVSSSELIHTTRILFDGHIAADQFVNRATYGVSYFSPTGVPTVIATGRDGDDLLDSMNGVNNDKLFGGPGLDVLLGDPGDTLTQ